MSRAENPSPVVSRPTLFDFLLIVAGFGLSLFLGELESLRVIAAPGAPAAAATFVIPILPHLVRLPEGVILLWPIFFLTQRVLGRKQGITSGEWLWVIAWLAVALLTALAAWQATAPVPEFLRDLLPRAFVLGYLILMPSMAAVALVLLLLGVVGRWQQPWTHNFALVLLLWPALPVAAILAFAKIPWPSH
jgi:hypothetical protein